MSKTYSASRTVVHALKGFTLDVERGERIAVLGPSGAGKSTLFRLLNATLRPSSGTLRFDGRDVSAMSGRELRAMRRRVGTVYQQFYLVPSLSVLENTLCGRLGHWSLWETIRSAVRPKKIEAEQALEVLKKLGLADKSRARADELSGGQQQRLAIARMLMQEPEVILADEPFASLDPSLKESLAELLILLVQEHRRTLIATMHDVDTALRYFTRIVALRGGRLLFDTTPAAMSRETLSALYAAESENGETSVRDEDEEARGAADKCEPECVPRCTY
ncbi:MAG TPA: phosphonate ABC transporter ATP-binding protein [Pyrinomonadaceae bacterium]|nr:phosphonate ABC transporter ATP-binding protein [Pyrinomonadaceae bacterium]